jgi:hypothetical protein
MVWDLMVAAAFVVISVLACFTLKFLLTRLTKPHQVASQHRLLIHHAIAPRSNTKLKIAGPQDEGKKNG